MFLWCHIHSLAYNTHVHTYFKKFGKKYIYELLVNPRITMVFSFSGFFREDVVLFVNYIFKENLLIHKYFIIAIDYLNSSH